MGMQRDVSPQLRNAPDSVLSVPVYEVPSSHENGWIGIHLGEPGLTVTSRWGGRVLNSYPSVETNTCRNIRVRFNLVRAALDLTFRFIPDNSTPLRHVLHGAEPNGFAHRSHSS